MSVRENVFLAVAECEGIAGRIFRSVLSHLARRLRAWMNSSIASA